MVSHLGLVHVRDLGAATENRQQTDIHSSSRLTEHRQRKDSFAEGPHNAAKIVLPTREAWSRVASRIKATLDRLLEHEY